MTDLDVIYEDNQVIAVYKPAGVATAGGPKVGTPLDQLVRHYIKVKYNKPGNVYLGIVHRLDRPVSGVIVFARTSRAASRLAGQFREGEVVKRYWAIVEGRTQTVAGRWEDWLVKNKHTGAMHIVTAETPGAQYAAVDYRLLASAEGLSWLELIPHTGRKHQLRLQVAHRGMPIVGDRRYGSRLPFTGGIALHAHALRFLHPTKKTPIELSVPAPRTWLRFQSLGVPVVQEKTQPAKNKDDQ
ncbi:MAG: RluA family pseudouridine synthase [Gemmataceae bacterium]